MFSFFMMVVLPTLAIIAVVIALIVVGDKREKAQAKKDAQTHPVDIHKIPMFADLLFLANAGKLHNYILTPYMFYYNFNLTHFKDSDGNTRDHTAYTNGTLIDFAKSGYQVMIPPIYRQCVRQFADALKQLPNVESVDVHYRTEIYQADSRFIDNDGHYASGQELRFDSYTVAYKVTDPSAGRSWT